jgi:hypothetical protein
VFEKYVQRPPLRTLAADAQKMDEPWYYLNDDRVQCGPVALPALTQLWKDAKIDGATQVRVLVSNFSVKTFFSDSTNCWPFVRAIKLAHQVYAASTGGWKDVSAVAHLRAIFAAAGTQLNQTPREKKSDFLTPFVPLMIAQTRATLLLGDSASDTRATTVAPTPAPTPMPSGPLSANPTVAAGLPTALPTALPPAPLPSIVMAL